MHPRAVQAAVSLKGDVNKEVWKSVYDRAKRSGAVSANHPMDVLLKALILYFVFGISSSGVEQDFAKSGWGFGNRRQKAYPETEEFCLKVLLDLPHHDLDEVIKLAQKVWVACYGVVRNCRGSNDGAPPRLSKGGRRVESLCQPVLEEGMVAHTEADFISERRRAAASSASSSSQGYAELIKIGGAEVEQPGWSHAHTKELQFQRQKLNARKVQAFAEKVIGDDDDATLVIAARAERLNRVKQQRARERKAERDTVALVGSTGVEVLAKIQGGALHVEDRLASPQLLAVMGQLSLKRVDICEANVFVVEVPGKSGQRVALASALRGGFHVSPEFIISKGVRGVASKFTNMARIPRVIYVSEAVSARNKNAFDLLQKVLANCEVNKVELVLGKGWDALIGLKTKHASNKSRLIAIVRSIETNHPEIFFVVFRTTFWGGGLIVCCLIPRVFLKCVFVCLCLALCCSALCD